MSSKLSHKIIILRVLKKKRYVRFRVFGNLKNKNQRILEGE